MNDRTVDPRALDPHFRRLERMYARAPVNRYFAPVLSVSEGRAEVRIVVRPDFFHAAHAIHGSVYFKALDDAAFFAVNSIVPEVFVLTVSFNVYLLRPVDSGTITAIGTVVSRGRNHFVADAVLSDEAQREVARGTGSFARSSIALGPEVGYE